MISEEAAGGRFTSIEVIDAGDLVNLVKFFKYLPSNNTQKQIVYNAKGRLRLKLTNSIWDDGCCVKAWIRCVQYCRAVWGHFKEHWMVWLIGMLRGGGGEETSYPTLVRICMPTYKI